MGEVQNEFEHKLSVTLHRFIINTKLKLVDFAFSTPNCVLTKESPWRCTYYGKDFTSNIFIAKKLPSYALVAMSFSKNKSFEEYQQIFKQMFSKDPSVTLTKFTLINWVEKFYTPYKMISLTKLLETLLEMGEMDEGNDEFIKKIKNKNKEQKPCRIKSYDQTIANNDGYDSDNVIKKKKKLSVEDDGSCPRFDMDQQKFSALPLYPFPKESNVVIEIYSTGKLNVAGIPDQEFFDNKIKPYINGRLSDLLKECELGQCNSEDILNEFIF